MNPVIHASRIAKKIPMLPPGRVQWALLILFLISVPGWLSAQSVTWSDSFVQGGKPTEPQCQNWVAFLDQLKDKKFVSVTLTGTYDKVGKSITNPADANALAVLLSTRTPGTITSGGSTWRVRTDCGNAICGDAMVTLSVDGNASECLCTDLYALRPQTTGTNWGGVNTPSCNALSQEMKLEFSSGVSIEASGSTFLCPGDNLKLTAKPDFCSGPYKYKWSNGATTESITVSSAGNYSVTVTGTGSCTATSSAVTVAMTDIQLDAGDDVTFCSDSVQLKASVTSNVQGTLKPSKVCIYDAESGNCSFTEDLCNDGFDLITTLTSFSSQPVTLANPLKLRYFMYYSPVSTRSVFRFILNGHEIGSFIETNATNYCPSVQFGQYPKEFTFEAEEFKNFWIDGEENTLTVEVESGAEGIYFAGASAEVLTSDEFYLWSPAAGLSNPTLQNPKAAPAATTTYTVTYTSPNGCPKTDQVVVTVDCDAAPAPPVVISKPVTAALDGNCEVTVDPKDFVKESSSPSGLPLTFSISPPGPYAVGETEITLTVTDSKEQSSSCTTTLTVQDLTLPQITAPADIIVENDPGSCGAIVDIGQPETSDNCGVKGVSNDHPDNIFEKGETLVTWTVTDVHGNTQTATQKVTVVNTDPVITSVTVSASPVSVNCPVSLDILYADTNVGTATIDWGDHSAVQTVSNPAPSFQVSHAYDRQGSFSVTVTVTDLCGKSTYFYETVSVFNNPAFSVRGNGWYESSPGAYLKNPRASGKAMFSFDARYSRTSQVPQGRATFDFKAGKIKFHTQQLDWLMANGQAASLKGTGVFNGARGYSIFISMVDGAAKEKDHGDREEDGDGKKDKHDKGKKDDVKKPDLIRVKISDPSGKVVYDTQFGEPEEALASTEIHGSISIKNDTQAVKETYESPVATSFGEESTSVYPNPFKDWLGVQFNSASQENVVIQVLDLSGKVIFNEVFAANADGAYWLDLPEGENSKPGVYIMIIKQGKRVQFERLVRN